MKKLITIIAAILCFVLPFAHADTAAVIEEAKTHLGKPYRYGAKGPKRFDCSGFTYYCFYTIEEIELSRSAKDQGYDESYEKIEEIENLIPGDLVCFNTKRGDKDLSDHVGIYLGEGDFIHCSSGKRRGVVISTLLEGYYNERFSWGRRILGGEINEYND